MHFEYCDDHMIVIFYKLTCFNLNFHEIKRVGKGKQTKTVKFELYEDRVFLVSINTRVEKANIRCNQSILKSLDPTANQHMVLLLIIGSPKNALNMSAIPISV